MEAIILVFAIVIGLGAILMVHGNRGKRIEEKIESMGGEVLNIERRNFLTGIGPFMVVGKGRVVYRIEYRINNEIREGWVRFGGLFGPDWRL